MSGFTRYLMVQDAISDLVGRLASWIAVVLTGMLLFEVLMRYGINRPTAWGHELSTMLFGVMGILAGAYALRYQAHVRSEVVYMHFPPRVQHFCDFVVFLMGLIVLLILFRMSIDFAWTSFIRGEVSGKSSWRPLLWPVKTVIPVGVLLLILQSIAEMLRALMKLLGRDFIDPRERDTTEATEIR
mgnify:CR=1 FL=1